MSAWNNWYHCTGSTYGTWLRGDPRGWRSRGHREHVDGDYKTPPPSGVYDQVFEQSKHLMKRSRVILNPTQRGIACLAMGDSLLQDNVELIDLCVGARHWHVLARFHPLGSILTKDRIARVLMGRAKARSSRALSKEGLVAAGGVWAARCRVLPIRDRAHQLNVVRYIRDHARKGAAVWSQLQS